MQHSNTAGCILLKFYIKPQLSLQFLPSCLVVSYWNSTSNHNKTIRHLKGCIVVSYWNSTSNHNIKDGQFVSLPLYLIEILHQTTTIGSKRLKRSGLYLIEILHQTTTAWMLLCRVVLLYLIEILHQTTTLPLFFRSGLKLYLIEILHQTTTPGQNVSRNNALYLIEILHQTTTRWSGFFAPRGCILLKFYIKPQPLKPLKRLCVVVSYWNSTSNYNMYSLPLLER